MGGTSEEIGKDGTEGAIHSNAEDSKMGLCVYRIRPDRELGERETGDDHCVRVLRWEQSRGCQLSGVRQDSPSLPSAKLLWEQ